MKNSMAEKNRTITEAEIIEYFINFLKKQGYRIQKEVPNMGQNVDVAATRGRWITFFEVKTKDWKRAIKQCNAHSLVADYIYIVIATVSVSDLFYGKAKDLGIGIVHFKKKRKNCELVLKARRNYGVWCPQQRHLRKNMEEIEYVS